MARPADTVVVKDEAGEARQREPIDAKEIVEQGGTYEVSEKDVAKATTRTDEDHPVGQGGTEPIEAFTQQPRENVEAKSGSAAKKAAENKDKTK